MRVFFNEHKKIIIVSIIIFVIFIITGIIGFIGFKSGIFNFKSKDTYLESTSYDGSFSISVNDVFEFKKAQKTDDYSLVLKSEVYNSEIYVSSFNSSRVRSIEDVLQEDKKGFTSKFKSISQLSELSSVDVSEYKVYKYSFKSSNRFIQCYYIVSNKNVYIIDFDIDTSKDYEYNLEDYTEEIIESFKIL